LKGLFSCWYYIFFIIIFTGYQLATVRGSAIYKER
jgi:hypothetical protein